MARPPGSPEQRRRRVTQQLSDAREEDGAASRAQVEAEGRQARQTHQDTIEATETGHVRTLERLNRAHNALLATLSLSHEDIP